MIWLLVISKTLYRESMEDFMADEPKSATEIVFKFNVVK
jgi:uncharacterized membrane protein